MSTYMRSVLAYLSANVAFYTEMNNTDGPYTVIEDIMDHLTPDNSISPGQLAYVKRLVHCALTNALAGSSCRSDKFTWKVCEMYKVVFE